MADACTGTSIAPMFIERALPGVPRGLDTLEDLDVMTSDASDTGATARPQMTMGTVAPTEREIATAISYSNQVARKGGLDTGARGWRYAVTAPGTGTASGDQQR